MVTTPNLLIEHVVNAAQKVPQINAQADAQDNANQRSLDITITGDRVLTSVEARTNVCFNLSGTPAAFTLTLPDGDRVFMVSNKAGVICTVKATSAGTTVDLGDEGVAAFRQDGVDIVAVGTGLFTEYLPAAAFQPTVTDGCGALTSFETTAGRPDIVGLPFDGGATEERAQAQFRFPTRWDNGTLLFQVSHAHGGLQGAGLDGVVWGVDAVANGDNETFDVVYGTVEDALKDASASQTHHLGPISGALTVGGTPVAGDMTTIRVRRRVGEAGDDLDVDARFLGIALFWIVDKPSD